MDIGRLRSRWQGLLKPFGENGYVSAGFDDLVGRYSERHRHYHNLHHVSGCLDAFDGIAKLLVDPFAVEAAIWFHDVIYDPRSRKNEARSADYARAYLSATSIESGILSGILYLIHLTRHPSNPSTRDEKYLIDIDLSTLGAEPSQYDRYELWIRKEYAYVPGMLYKKGRRKLLNAFLDCEHIYRTDYFRERLESKARANIQRALKNL